MDDLVSDQHLASPAEGRIPTAVQASTLHSQVEAVLRVLRAARANAKRNSALSRERLIEKYGTLLERAMLALGAALADFIYQPGPPQISIPCALTFSNRALVAAFVEVDWRHWDEAMWREMLGQLPFDLSASRFEVILPATIPWWPAQADWERPNDDPVSA